MSRRRHRSSRPARFRITQMGWAFLAISLMICAGAVNVQAPLLFLMFGVMFSLLTISVFITLRTVSQADLRRDVPSRVWQNQTVHLGYYLSNPRRRGSLLGLEVVEIAPQGVQAASAYCVHLGPRSVFRAGGRFAARRRGRIRLNLVRLATQFPFGLIAARRDIVAPADMVVWPARGRLKRGLLQGGAVETSRSAPSPVSGGQDEFFGLREYRSGDNPRWIAWKRSATRPTPVVREMARPLPEVLMVVLDTFCPGDAGADFHALREKMIRFAGTLIDHALSRGYLVGLALGRPGGAEYHRPAPGRGQLRTLLDALADVEEKVQRPLEETLARVEPAAVRGAVVVVVSPNAARETGDSGKPAAAGPDREGRPPVGSPPAGPGTPVPFGCRRLLAVSGDNLDEFFEDEPLAAKSGGNAE